MSAAVKNHISKDAANLLRAEFLSGLFQHQREWLRTGGESKRFVVNARQIGATTYFALEGLMRAISGDEHQVFLSASKRQSAVIREVIKRFVAQVAQVELVGDDEITLSSGVVLSFCSPMDVFRAAQRIEDNGYWDADLWKSVYVDGAFWISNFERLNEAVVRVAPVYGGRQTYFGGLPESPWNTGAWKLWSARPASPVGRNGSDGVWRQIVTAQDAVNGGFDVFDLEEMRGHYSVEDFNRLFLCCVGPDAEGAAA